MTVCNAIDVTKYFFVMRTTKNVVALPVSLPCFHFNVFSALEITPLLTGFTSFSLKPALVLAGWLLSHVLVCGQSQRT